MVNSQWLSSPAFKIISNFSQLPKTFLSTNLLENNMQLPKMQNALWQKKGSSLLFKTRANQLSKSIMHIQEKNEVAPKRPNSLANAKQQVYFENKGWSSCPQISSPDSLHHHAKFEKQTKTQMLFHHSAANPEFRTKKALLYPNSSRHTKTCRNVAHVHRINGSLYFHTPFCYDSHAVQPSKFPTCNTMWGSAHEVISSQQLQMYRKYLCTLIIPVSSLLSVSTYSLMQVEPKRQVEITSQRIPCSRHTINEVP